MMRHVILALFLTAANAFSPSAHFSGTNPPVISLLPAAHHGSVQSGVVPCPLFPMGRRNCSIVRLKASTTSPSKSTISTIIASFEKTEILTLLRVGIPSVLAGLVATCIFPALALRLALLLNDKFVFRVLAADSACYIQNFLSVTGLLYSLLIGETFSFVYAQQEAIFYALFAEVTEAKSLIEQVALLCRGRSMYPLILESIGAYIRDDLKQITADPAVKLSTRPVDDPLEKIMYMTSVGLPSSVYKTIRTLRQARAARLGALQRKVPPVHMLLLWTLAAPLLMIFPLLGAGTQLIGGYNILTVEGCLFGILVFGTVMINRVIAELWKPRGGAYSVDSVLKVMIRGLDEELKMRIDSAK